MRVKYRNKIYEVLAFKMFDDCSFFKLKSNYSLGSPFPAKKTECKVVKK